MQKQNLVVGTGNGSASSTGSGIGPLLRVYRVQTVTDHDNKHHHLCSGLLFCVAYLNALFTLKSLMHY